MNRLEPIDLLDAVLMLAWVALVLPSLVYFVVRRLRGGRWPAPPMWSWALLTVACLVVVAVAWVQFWRAAR